MLAVDDAFADDGDVDTVVATDDGPDAIDGKLVVYDFVNDDDGDDVFVVAAAVDVDDVDDALADIVDADFDFANDLMHVFDDCWYYVYVMLQLVPMM